MTVPVHGLPPLLREGLEVAIVPPPLKEDRWHEVRHASDAGQEGQLVELSGARSIGDATKLVGKTLLARLDDLPANYALLDVDALLGREVVDEAHTDFHGDERHGNRCEELQHCAREERDA